MVCKICKKFKLEHEFPDTQNFHGKRNKCIDCYFIEKKAKYRRLKIEIIDYYGGQCECCSENKIELLTIDHINGGGRQETKNSTTILYQRIKMANFPSNKYRVLCFNCNCSRYWFGKCH